MENCESRTTPTVTLLLLMTTFIGWCISHDTAFGYPFVPVIPAQRGSSKGCSVASSSVTGFRWDMRHGYELCRNDIVLSCLFFSISYCFLRRTLIEITGNFYLNTAFQMLAVTETMNLRSLSCYRLSVVTQAQEVLGMVL